MRLAGKNGTSVNVGIERKMNWNELIAEVKCAGVSGGSDEPLCGVEYDSRRVGKGSIFVAMKGGTTDGNRFVD